MATKRTPKRRPRTLKQLATKVIRTAEEKAENLIRDVKNVRAKSKPRVAKRAVKRPVRAKARARRGARARPLA